MNNIAILLAAGKGERVKGDIPKQFLRIGNKMLIEYAMDTFQNHSGINEIAVVVQPEWIPLMEQLQSRKRYNKFAGIISGGKERFDSSLAALQYLDDCHEESTNVFLHDAARPLVNKRIIDEILVALSQYNAVITAIPTTDTIVEVSDGVVSQFPDRKRLMNVQTPQAFRLGAVKKAYKAASLHSVSPYTDDGGVLFSHLPDEIIYIVQGDVDNFKITYNNDIVLFRELLKQI